VNGNLHVERKDISIAVWNLDALKINRGRLTHAVMRPPALVLIIPLSWVENSDTSAFPPDSHIWSLP
jgi:hypothetical protein